MEPLPLMSLAELRIRLGGVSQQRADVLSRRPDFPKPVAVLRVGRIWHRDDVEAWMREHRPDPGGPQEAGPRAGSS